MKKAISMVIKAMMFIVVAYCVKVAVIDMWECDLAVEMVESARRVMAMM